MIVLASWTRGVLQSPEQSKQRAFGVTVAKGRRIRNGRITAATALRHLREFHPGTPQVHALEIAERIAKRSWDRATLGKVVGIVITNYVRHELTDYERLLRAPGIAREEARMLVHKNVADVLATWSVGPAQSWADEHDCG